MERYRKTRPNRALELFVWLLGLFVVLFILGWIVGDYAENRIKNTPDQFMMKAIEENKIDDVRYWLDHGASPNALGMYDKHTGLAFWYWRYGQPAYQLNNTALENALSHPQILKLLLERGADPHLSNDRALHSALSYAHLQSIHLLLPYQIQQKATSKIGEEMPPDEKISLMFLQNLADINRVDKEGNTLLGAVLSSSMRWENAEYLLSLGANINYQNKMKNGETLLITFVKARERYKVLWLIENHANVNLRDKSGHAALYYARQGKAFRNSEEAEAIMRYLVEAGAKE